MRAEENPPLFLFFEKTYFEKTQKAPLEFKSPHITKNAQHEAVHFLLELVERFELSAY